MTKAPSIKEALERARKWLVINDDPRCQQDLVAVEAALATLQPSGERRDDREKCAENKSEESKNGPSPIIDHPVADCVLCSGHALAADIARVMLCLIHYADGHELRGPWLDSLIKLKREAHEIIQGISAHPPASDCDKQGCMGDNSPGDAKDLQELLNSPSVLDETTKSEGGVEGHAATSEVVAEKARSVGRGSSTGFESPDSGVGNEATARQAGIESGPSDRTADVTGLQPFSWRQVNAYEACNGTIWRTAEEAQAESRRATDAFTVGRR